MVVIIQDFNPLRTQLNSCENENENEWDEENQSTSLKKIIVLLSRRHCNSRTDFVDICISSHFCILNVYCNGVKCKVSRRHESRKCELESRGRASSLQKCSTVSSNMHRTNEQWMMMKLLGLLNQCAGAVPCLPQLQAVDRRWMLFHKMFKQVGSLCVWWCLMSVYYYTHGLTFWFVLLLIGMYVCKLLRTIFELFALSPVIPGNPSIGQCEWANLWIRRLDCWFQQWAETRNTNEPKRTHFIIQY